MTPLWTFSTPCEKPKVVAYLLSSFPALSLSLSCVLYLPGSSISVGFMLYSNRFSKSASSSSVVDSLGRLKLWAAITPPVFCLFVTRLSSGFLMTFMFFGDSLDRCTLLGEGDLRTVSIEGCFFTARFTRRYLLLGRIGCMLKFDGLSYIFTLIY